MRETVIVCLAGFLCSCATAGKSPRSPDLSSAAVRSSRYVVVGTIDGRRVTLVDYEADVTVVAFWFLFCEPCLLEMPYLERLYQQYRKDPAVSILSVSIDPKDQAPDVAQSAGDLKLSFPVLLDPDSDLMDRFGRGTVPMIVFITRDFKVHREFAFLPEPVESFLAAKGKIIELAKRGEVLQRPTEDAVQGPSDAVKEPSSDTSPTFWWPKEVAFTDREKRAVRHMLGYLFPNASARVIDEMMAQVEEGARAGKEVTLRAIELLIGSKVARGYLFLQGEPHTAGVGISLH
jgi:thiol-disulfide isomerase/thioredoxin